MAWISSKACAWLKVHWRLRDILIGLILGFIIEGSVRWVFRETYLVRTAENWVADATMSLAEQTESGPVPTIPFVFVNVNSKTWREWGYCLVTPKDQLATLVTAVRAAKPSAIILDYDLAWLEPYADVDGRKDCLDSGKAQFARMLETYPTDAPPLILVRSLEPSPDFAYPSQRPTLFDKSTLGHANIQWGTARVSGDGDGVARRWRLYEATCRDGIPDVLPSIELAAAAAVRPPSDPLAQLMKPLVPANCDGPPRLGGNVIVDVGRPVVLNGDLDQSRILYSIRWERDATVLGPWARYKNREMKLVTVLPSRDVIAAADKHDQVAILSGRIAVLGNSFEEDGDYQLTPLGMMPGSMVMINALHSILVRGSPTELLALAQLLIAFALAAVNAVLFSFLRLFLAVFAGFMAIAVLMVATLSWFESGSLIDLAVPSIGVLAHRLYVIAQNGWELLRRRGVRALLREHHRNETVGDDHVAD